MVCMRILSQTASSLQAENHHVLSSCYIATGHFACMFQKNYKFLECNNFLGFLLPALLLLVFLSYFYIVYFERIMSLRL